MGIFDRLFKKGPEKWKYAQAINGYTPLFSQFGTNIYASDVVQMAVNCIVQEIKKLNPTHVRYIDNDPAPVRSTVQDILNYPNELMTTSEFLEKTTWLLLLNYNVFLLPVYYTWTDEKSGAERRYYEAIYPVRPTQVDFIEDAGGRLFVKFYFRNGDTSTVLYSDVIHIRYNYSVNDYMGGNEIGQPDHNPLLETLQLNKTLLEGVANAMKASYAINGVVKYNTMMDDGKTEANLAELERKLRRSESGFLPLDLKADFTYLPRDTKIVDKDTLEFIDTKILRYWRVPLCILQGDYSKEEYEAFYQSALEPIVISVSQALTKGLFTRREKAYGNRVELYPKDLIFMSVEQTIKMVDILSPTGALTENEKRTAFGLRPLPELEGKRLMSLNWIDANNAGQYQIGKDANVNADIADEGKEDI